MTLQYRCHYISVFLPESCSIVNDALAPTVISIFPEIHRITIPLPESFYSHSTKSERLKTDFPKFNIFNYPNPY